MSGEELVKAFGYIDEDLLEREAEVRERSGRRNQNGERSISMRAKLLAAAAILTVLSAAGISLLSGRNGPEPGRVAETIPITNEAVTDESTAAETDSVEVPPEEMSGNTENTTGTMESIISGAEYPRELTAEEAAGLILTESEYLIEADSRGFTVYDRNRQIAAAMENAVVVVGDYSLEEENELIHWVLGHEGRGYRQRLLNGLMLWPVDRPLPVVLDPPAPILAERDSLHAYWEYGGNTFHNSTEGGRCGLYDIEENRWIADPEEHRCLNLLGEGLWTDIMSEEGNGTARLMRMDGSVAAIQSCPVRFSRYHNYVRWGDGYYDLTGNPICFEGDLCTVLDITEKYVVCFRSDLADEETGKLYTLFKSPETGEVLMAEQSGLSYGGHFGNYLVWLGEGARMLVTDDHLNQVFSEADFYERNPEFRLENMIREAPPGFDLSAWLYPPLSCLDIDEEKGTITLWLHIADWVYPSNLYIVCDRNLNWLEVTTEDSRSETELRNNPVPILEIPEK